MKKTKEFITLQKEWYARLKEDGFIDTEYFNKKTMEPFDYQVREGSKFKVSPEEFEQKRHYYILASQFLHEYDFATELDKEIWRLHAEGEPHRAIAIQTKCSKIKALRTIQRLKKICLNQTST